nr:MAG TPA: hypothetical protein [Caudoviricetes sp.]
MTWDKKSYTMKSTIKKGGVAYDYHCRVTSKK